MTSLIIFKFGFTKLTKIASTDVCTPPSSRSNGKGLLFLSVQIPAACLCTFVIFLRTVEMLCQSIASLRLVSKLGYNKPILKMPRSIGLKYH